MAIDKLEGFIRRRLFTTNGSPCVKMSLLHLIEGRPPQVMLSRKVNTEELEDEVSSLVDEIRETSQNHASEASKAQRYQVVAYAEHNEVIAQYSFRLRPDPDSVDPGESEPATPTGALALSMRLTESFAQMLMRSMSGMLMQQSEAMNQLTNRNRYLEERHNEAIEVWESLMNHRQERELEMTKATRQEERKDRLLQAGERIAVPLIMDKLTGRKPVKDFLESLNAEQQSQIVGLLTPTQVENLMNVLSAGEEGKKDDASK